MASYSQTCTCTNWARAGLKGFRLRRSCKWHEKYCYHQAVILRVGCAGH